MAVKITDAGAAALLDVLFGTASKMTSFKLQLLTDAVAASDADTVATHTVALQSAAAVEKTLSNNASYGAEAGIPTVAWAPQTFTFTGALDGAASLTGYQVITGTTLLWVEKLTLPTPTTNGDTITITPKFQLGNGTPE